MLKTYCFLAALMMLVFSCTKDNNTSLTSGTYAGSFIRSCGPAELCALRTQATVTVSFVSGMFIAESLDVQYPGNCEGTYSQSGDSVFFSNNCSLDSNVNQDINLRGGYQIRYSTADSISLRRSFDLNNPEYPVSEGHFKRVVGE